MCCASSNAHSVPTETVRSLTWLVGIAPYQMDALCLEAAAPSKVEVWKRQHGHSFNVIVTPAHLNWLNLPLTREKRHLINMGIKRNANAVIKPRKGRDQKPAIPTFEVNAIIRRVATLHDMEIEEVLIPNRTRLVARARAHAIFLLRKELNLSQPAIAQLLGYKDPSTVRSVLSKTLDEILR